MLSEPSDDGFKQQWGLQNSGQIVSGQVGTTGIDINILNAWNITKGSDEVKVAIIDTGIDINHPDLAASIYRNPNETINWADDDGNGYADDINGWNFVNDTNNIFTSEDEDTHGTHIAGIIAAGINNGGVVGVSPNVRIVPLKFISGNTGYTSDAIRAIEYCKKAGIEIVNISWGGSDYNPALLEAMKNCSITFICAAGNAGKNIDTSAVYPAAFDLPNIVTVSANDSRGQLASFSNYGNEVDVSAPGVNIYSTLPDNKYGYLSGTSMAAPFVTGTVALLKSIDSSLTPAEIKKRILDNVTKSSNLSGKVSTSGRLNAYSALINNILEVEDIPLPSETPTPQIPTDKSKEPSNIYDISLEGNGKIAKPLKGDNNLFVDALVNKGTSNTLSENGIDNLSINRMKGDFVSITWTTNVEGDSVLFYGKTSSLENKISYPELTTKHQLTLKIDDIDNISFYKVFSTSRDGQVFESSLNENTNINDLGGEPVQPIDVTEAVYSTSAQNVNTLSYVMDNGSNHSLVTAQPIGECTVFGTANGTVHDYYTVNLTAGKTYSINLKGMAEGEDYDVILLDNVLEYVGYSVNSSNFDENISFTATVTGSYYIDIQPYIYNANSAHHNYQLMVYSTENAADVFEPNDSIETAYALANGAVIAPTININTDEDWFVLDTTKTGKLSVTMKSIPFGCDYDMQVYDANGSLLGGSYSGNNHDEKFDSIITAQGKYYVRVYSYTGSNAADTYELTAGVYVSDQYEENDDVYNVNMQNKSVISLNSCISGTIDNQDDIDWYKFILTSDADIAVRLQNIPSGTDYDIVVYTYTNGEFLEVGRSITDGNEDESIISHLPAGSYFIKIYSYWGSSENQSYRLSINDETKGIIKIDFDKTSANVDEIITATLKVDNINNFAGYQVNLKYDPQVVIPVDSYLLPYNYYTTPESGNILANKNYIPFSQAFNDLERGLLTFGNCYMNMNAYKASGIAETSGSIAVVRFKVIDHKKINIRFENSPTIPDVASGVELFDWNGNIISTNLIVEQPPSINDSLPVNSQSVDISSVEENEGSAVSAFGTYKISGYVVPESVSNDKSGFKVSIEGTDIFKYTDDDGYFEFPSVTISGVFKIVITKETYLRREITDIQLSTNIMIGTKDKPIEMWSGDINQDNAINMKDIIDIAISFNSTSGSPAYKANCDLNKDNSINMADVIIIAKRFGMTQYGSVKVTTGAFVDIATAGFTSGLKDDGTLWDLTYGRIIPELTNVKAIYEYKQSAHILALKMDGSVVKVEYDSYSGKYLIENVNITGVKDISSSLFHTLYLKEDGTLYTSGINHYGQLGVGVIGGEYKEPVLVQGLPEGKVIDIAVGDEHSIILMEDGTVWTWGNNYNGALGIVDGFKQTSSNVNVTYLERPGPSAYSTAFPDDCLGLEFSGIYTAGNNFLFYGLNVSYGPRVIRYKTGHEVNVVFNFTDIDYSATFYLDDKKYRVVDGKLPTDEINIGIDMSVPEISVNENIKLNIIINDNPANKRVNILIHNDVNVNGNKMSIDNGRISIYERSGSCIAYPVKVEELTNVKAVYAGKSSSYALKNDGSMWAWGENSRGELNIDGLSDVCEPTEMKDLTDIIYLSEGDYNIIALKSDGTVWTWGRNYYGNLGVGTFEDYVQLAPTELKSLNGVVDVTICDTHTAALKSDGSVFIWGYKKIQLANGITEKQCLPVEIVNTTDTRLSRIQFGFNDIPLFNPNITEYSVVLDASTTKYPIISAYTMSPLAKYNIIEPVSFPGIVKIKVTSPDGNKERIYTINFTVNRQNPSSSDAPSEVFSAKGSIDFGGDVDIFYFTPKETKKYTILSEGGTDTFIDVYKIGNDNELIASNDDNESGFNFYLECDMQINSRYCFVVSHFDGNEGTGQYIIKVIDSVRRPLTGNDAYLEDLVKECKGTISIEEGGKYKVTIDSQHIAIFHSNMYRIDPFNGKVVVNFHDFINYLGMVSASSNSNTPENTLMDLKLDYKIYPVSFREDKLVHDEYTYDSAGVGTGNIAQIQFVLNKLGCGRVFKGYGSNGAIIEELEVTGVYNKNTVNAIRQFKEFFMGDIGASGEIVDNRTAEELTKYNHLRVISNIQGGGPSWLKDKGVRVREYLTKCYTPSFNGIFEFERIGTINKLYYREFKYAPRIQLKIDDLYFEDKKNENKCYAKIKDIEKAVTQYLNDKVAYAAESVSSVIICPGKIDRDYLNWSDPIELQTMYTIRSDSGFYEPYADISELAACFNGWIGAPEQVSDTTCVAQFYNVDSVLTKLYFETGNNQSNPVITAKVLDASKKPVYGINFYRISDPYVKNKVAVNVIQLAQYLGYYNIYSVRQKDNSLQLCIDASRIAKGKVNVANIVSMTVSVLPGTGEIKDIQEAITGVDLITGEKLSVGEQVFTAVCVFLPVISGKAVRVKKAGFIKATTKTLAEGALKLKNLFKPNNEQIFEVVKSVVQKDDLLIFNTIDGKTFSFSKAQTKAELMIEKNMTSEMADDVLRCIGNQCFSGDTLVSTKDGLKRIDSIQVGEFVLAKDVNTGKIEYKEIKTLYNKEIYEFVHLKIEDEEIRTTATHLFFTDSGWWKAAENLKVGDKILNSKGEFKVLVGKSVETLKEAERVYNLNVDEFHTYFVGSQGLLVHNDCTAEMMGAGREAIERARLKGITDSNTLSEIGTVVAETLGKSTNEIITLARNIIPNRGFNTFDDLKAFLGSPGPNCQWHHLVEQSQITRSGFSTQNINNLQNIVSLPSGSGSVHAQISGYFSSKPAFTNGLTVRDWLAGKSFDEQIEFGINKLKEFGDVVPTSSGWIFLPF